MPILEGKPNEIQERLSSVSRSAPRSTRYVDETAIQKWQPTLLKNWMVFIPTQAIKSVNTSADLACSNGMLQYEHRAASLEAPGGQCCLVSMHPRVVSNTS